MAGLGIACVGATGKRLETTCKECGIVFSKAASTFLRINRNQFCTRGCADAHGLSRVRCAWPGCTTEMPCRVMVRRRRGREHVEYKTELKKKGIYRRSPICVEHEAVIQRFTPDVRRFTNGNHAWMLDVNADLGSRGVTSPSTRLMIFWKTKGCCGDCGCGLDWFERPVRWNADHIVPYYRGGLTSFSNLIALCRPCHDRKTAAEKSEVARKRYQKIATDRWLTHPQKDALIAQLQADVARLKLELETLRGKERSQH